jgi:hypothetical protein
MRKTGPAFGLWLITSHLSLLLLLSVSLVGGIAAIVPNKDSPAWLTARRQIIANSRCDPASTYFRKEVSEHRREAEMVGTEIPHEDIPIVPQYTYTMNGNLCRTFRTAGVTGGSDVPGADAYEVNPQTLREWDVRRETQVTRSPAEVFAFGEENSWTINEKSRWPATYNLSGPWVSPMEYGRGHDHNHDFTDSIIAGCEFPGAITLGGLDIGPSYVLAEKEKRMYASKVPDTAVGDAFATCHRPRGGDLNTGHSYVSLLDGHVRKVTVADQLRRSRQVENLPTSRLGPGGNLHLAWPLEIPPLAGWENQ